MIVRFTGHCRILGVHRGICSVLAVWLVEFGRGLYIFENL